MNSKLVLIAEAVVITAVGVAAGFGANGLRARAGKPHIDLHQQYFYRPTAPRPEAGRGPQKPPADASTDGAAEPVHPEHDFQTMDTARLEAIVDGSDVASSTTLILDARDEEHYEEGHIPGAYRCYFSTLEQDFEAIRELAVDAGYQIVVYCNGGECEDSINLCMALTLERGVARENVFLYEGGWTEWNQEGRPVETGPRGGGDE